MDKNTNTKKKQKKWTGRKILNTVVIIFLSCVMIGGVGGFFLLNDMLEDRIFKDVEDMIPKEPTRIYDINNEEIGTLGAEQRENITYEQLPQSVIDAFLAIEDSRYFTHNGFDLPRFIMSALNNIKNGNMSQGGSTLTMQYVDNFITSFLVASEESNSTYNKIALKVQEIFSSMEYEKILSKKEIFTHYVNQINFGYTARGIQRGSQYYFGKNVEELTLSESAFLAGVINAPNLYNPYRGTEVYENGTSYNFYESAVARRNSTLAQMLNHGYITEDEYHLAVNTELAFQLNGTSDFQGDPYEDYLMLVKKEVLELTGKDPAIEPMDIYTSMDPGAQKHAMDIQAGNVVDLSMTNDLYQLGFTVMNNQTGEIIAVGNGFNENAAPEFKKARAIELHQPGSTMKPLLAYSLTFDELGWATTHAIEDDDKVTFGPGLGPVVNSNGKYEGMIGLDYALGISKNVTAVKAFQQLLDKKGYDGMREFASKLGFDDKVVENLNLQYCIGGSTMEASPVQMAAAYSIFANEGKYIKPHTVTKIVFRDGETEDYTFDLEKNSEQVISPQAAYMMSTLLEKVVSGDWGNLLYVLRSNYPVYGKSGTSDWADLADKVGGMMKDEWMVSYTNRYTIATWSGFDAMQPGAYISEKVLYANIPGKINKSFQDYLANGTEKSIERPDGISSITHLFGQYPYISVPGNVDSPMVRNGLIKSQFANLNPYSSPNIENLSSFNVKQLDENSNTVSFAFAPYPDAKWQSQEDELSRIFGKVRYNIDVKLNGMLVDTLSFDEPTGTVSIDALKPGTNVELIGYYVFPNSGDRSNEISISVGIRSGEVFTISTHAGTGGTITPTFEVAAGGSATFVVTPYAGYRIRSVLIDGESYTVNPGEPFTIQAVTSNMNVYVTFEEI